MEIDRPAQSDDDIDVRLEWPSDPLASDPPPPAPPKHDREPDPAPPRTPEPDDVSTTSRELIEAYDRLGDRLLGRLRDLRDAVDTDLATIRSELAGLREAVEDVDDRVELRELRAVLDQVRVDVSGLRSAVRERPAPSPAGSTTGAVTSIEGELAQAVDPLIEEVAGLRTEVASLRRRIALRANGTPVELSDDQLQRIVIAISAHLRAGEVSSAQVRAR